MCAALLLLCVRSFSRGPIRIQKRTLMTREKSTVRQKRVRRVYLFGRVKTKKKKKNGRHLRYYIMCTSARLSSSRLLFIRAIPHFVFCLRDCLVSTSNLDEWKKKRKRKHRKLSIETRDDPEEFIRTNTTFVFNAERVCFLNTSL